jgi:hypothetical protein
MNATTDKIDAGKEFENLILFSHRLNALLEQSALFTDQSLSVPAFSFLSVVSSEPGIAARKAAARASIFDKREQRMVRTGLVASGLLREVQTETGTKTVEVTEAGSAALEALRAGFSSAADSAKVKSWKAVPRFASIVRALRPTLGASTVQEAAA